MPNVPCQRSLAPFGRSVPENRPRRSGKRSALVAVLAANAGLSGAAFADTPIRCRSLDDQEPITIDAVPIRQRPIARFLQEQAATIAARRGAAGSPVLVRLKSNDPSVVTLVAWVRDPAGGAAVLILHTSGLDQTHSLVNGPLRFVAQQNEPVFRRPHSEITGFSYQFFDQADHHIHMSDEMVRIAPPGKAVRTSYQQKISTGYSYGGLPKPCRASGEPEAE